MITCPELELLAKAWLTHCGRDQVRRIWDHMQTCDVCLYNRRLICNSDC